MRRGKKKGQYQISFGMIFSIILIIVFLAFAFYVITHIFLPLQRTAETGKFLNDFQGDVERVWRSAQSSEQVEYFLGSKISDVCIVDFSAQAKGENAFLYNDLKKSFYGSENLVFNPVGSSDLDSKEIKNIDLSGITVAENPYCLKNTNGKIQLTLKKEINEALVTVTR